jgi:hypothetical protein
MTDPASAIKRLVDDLIHQQISTLRKSSSLTPSELTEYQTRSAKIKILFAELDRRKPLPSFPVRRTNRLHPAL